MSRAHTRLLMAASALFLFCLGAVLTFAPSETVAKAGGPVHLLLDCQLPSDR